MQFRSRHRQRDLELPEYRERLLENALNDLTNDPDVLAIYLGEKPEWCKKIIEMAL